MLAALDFGKASRFALLGAIGCVAGWAVGEGFLAVAMREATADAPAAPSLASKPAVPHQRSTRTVASAVTPPTPEVSANRVVAPAPPAPLITAAQRAVPQAPAPPAVDLSKQTTAPPPPPEFQERIQEFGGKSGDIQITLIWNNTNDLDLHCIDPNGDEIYYSQKTSRSGGTLDIDKNAGCGDVIRRPVENIFWPRGKAPAGTYRVYVNHFAVCRDPEITAFKVNVLHGAQRKEFSDRIRGADGRKLIYEFDFDVELQLAVSPTMQLFPGTKNQLIVRLGRPLRGALKVTPKSVPSGLTVPEITIPAGTTSATIEVTAAADAAPGKHEVEFSAENAGGSAAAKTSIEVVVPPPALQLAVADRITVMRGASNILPVTISRERFAGPIGIRISPAVPGIVDSLAAVAADRNTGSLELTAADDAPTGTRIVTVVAQGPGGLTAEAKTTLEVVDAPKSLKVAVSERIELTPGGVGRIVAVVARERLTGPVKIRAVDPPTGITIKDVEISPEKDATDIEIVASEDAGVSSSPLKFVAEIAGGSAVASTKLDIVPAPKALQVVADAKLTLTAGSERNELPVAIGRSGFAGPVRVRLDGELEGVSADAVIIEPDESEGTVIIDAASSAAARVRELRITAVAVDDETVAAEWSVATTIVRPPGRKFDWRLVITIGLWTALLTVGLALALVVGQNRYLGRPWLNGREAVLLLIGGTVAGIFGGGIGQASLATLDMVDLPREFGFILGWIVLGGLVGRGLGFFVPNLKPSMAALAGACGGLIGAGAFLGVSFLSDVAGRAAGATILGACIGLVIALIEAAFRDAWLDVAYGPRESRTVNLGPEPVRIGSNSAACAVWTPGVEPVVLRFWIAGGKVMREQVPSRQQSEVTAGHRERVGGLEIVVRRGTSAMSGAPQPVRTPPPPPPPSSRVLPPPRTSISPPPGSPPPSSVAPVYLASVAAETQPGEPSPPASPTRRVPPPPPPKPRSQA